MHVRFGIYRVYRAEGLDVRNAWTAAGDAIVLTDAMLEVITNMPNYDVCRMWSKK